MKILNTKPIESLYLHVTGKGEDVEIRICHMQCGYYDDKMSKIDLSIKEAKIFYAALANAIEEGEKKALIIENEDDE